jgi:glycosyltransferase involved in cell wall biosynthesis
MRQYRKKSMPTPVISVVMSVCNGERYLRDAVDSILDQTCEDFEFIIINDGSTDGSREILESYNDGRIFLIHQDNTGLTRALKKGISLSRGEYIARIDADDSAKSVRLEKQLVFLRNNPKVILLGSNCYKVDENGSIVGITDLPVDDLNIKWNLLFYNCVCHSTVMFRRKEVENLGGYNATMQYAQDYDLWLRIAKKYSVANLQEPLVNLRVPGAGAITFENSDEQTQQAERIHLNVLRTLDPAIEGRENDVNDLKNYMFRNGKLRKIEDAEKLFISIFSAFCNSPFTVNISKDIVNSVMFVPYVKFAWSYFNRGDASNFNRCVTKIMDSGFPGPFEVPTDDISKNERALFEALENYFRANIHDVKLRARKRNFLSAQYTYFAWHYYAMGAMRQFRRCLHLSFRNHPSPKGAVLFLKSLLGKKTMEGIHRLRSRYDETLHMNHVTRDDKYSL